MVISTGAEKGGGISDSLGHLEAQNIAVELNGSV